MTSPPEAPAANAHLEAEGVGGRVVRGSATRILAMAATNVLVAIGAVVLLRYLGVDDFGRYGTVMALVAIVQGVTDAGLTITGTRELTNVDGEERRQLLAHVLGLRIVLTAVGMVGAVVFAVAVGYDSQLVVGTALAGAGVFLLSVQIAMLLPLSVELRNGALAINDILRQGVMVVGWVILVVAGAGLDWFFAAQILVGVLMIGLVPLLLDRHHIVRPRWEARQLRALAAVGLPIAVAGVVAIIYYRVLTVLVSLLSSERQSGLFVSASRVFEVAYAVPLVLVTVVLPVMAVAARSDLARLRYVTQRMTEAMSLAGVALGLVIAGAAEPIIVLLGGSQYRDAAPVLRILAVALVSMFTAASWSPVLIATHNQRALALCSAIGLAVVVGLGFALIPGMDAVGAATAFAIADWFLMLTLLVVLRRVGHGTHLDFRFLLRLVPVTAVACAVVFTGWSTPVVCTAVGAVVFAVGTILTGLIPEEVRDAVRHGRSLRWGR
jgi:O-antigen/teichoic acid export membrane protein